MVPVFVRTLFVLIVLIVVLGIFVGTVVLQIYLSKRESKWPGLILPIVSFGKSLLVMLGIVLFSVVPARYYVRQADVVDITLISELPHDHEIFNQYSPRAVAVEDGINHLIAYGHISATTGSSILFVSGFYFILMNIPTAIFLIIYAICRDKRRRLLALSKMSVQDL